MTARRYAFAALLLACGGAQKQTEPAVTLPGQAAGSVSAEHGTLAPPTRDEQAAPVPVLASDPVWGSRTALVTIVEFTDLQCPFCSRAWETVKQLEKDYGEQTLRVVFKNDPLPFHQNARPAAEAAETVRALGGNGAFWAFVDVAFHNQADLSAANYELWAQQAGVPTPAFRAALDAHRYASKVDHDMALVAELHVQGTPHFFINGVTLGGAQPIDKFKTIIDAQVTAAKAKLAGGVAAEDLYTALAKENFKTDADDEESHEDTATVFKVPVGSAPQLGPKTALVTIVEYADFQCPYCKRVEPTLQQIRSTYGNDVRFVFKQEPLPFHPRAAPAAELALEARAEKGDTGFWSAHDALYDSQPKLDDADLEAVAQKLHLDVAKVKAAIASNKYARDIEHDTDESEDFEASGTPHFFINGRRLVGAQPFDKFKKIIDEEIPKARALVSAGTAADKVYDELTKNGKGPKGIEQKTVTFAGVAPVKGPATAPVTIVELADFQCPYCKKAEDTLKEVLAAYPTRVRLAWRHMPLPFHQHAELAAEASVEAFKQKGNDGFWKMHDALFAHQADPDGLERAQIDGYARTLGLDMTKFAAALDTAQHAHAVDADKQAANTAGASGTPTFFIGRGTGTGTWTAYIVVGAQPTSKFKRVIEAALAGHP